MESSSTYQNLNETDRKTNNVFAAQKQAQDFEMSNVTVVPDGKYTFRYYFFMINRTLNMHTFFF